MAIPLPNLDDRRWSDLVEQGRALIPLYAPEWTDHNASDPGITLMELLAWVTELDLYRLNRITLRQQRRMLRLLDIRPLPPRPATMVAALRLAAGSGPVALAPSVEFAGSTLDGNVALFQSVRDIDVVASELRAVQQRSAPGFHNVTAAWTRGDAVALFGDDPVEGSEVYLGFDQPLPAGAWTTLYVRLSGNKAGIEERRRLLADKGVNVLPPQHSIRVAWEYLAGADHWVPLEFDDDTRALTLSGVIRLRPAAAMTAQSLGKVAQALYYVRCRVTGGAFEAAPRAARILLNSVELVQAVPAWQMWSIASGTSVLGLPVAGQAVSIGIQFDRGSITALTVDPAVGDDPRFLVLGYVPPTAAAAGSLTLQATLVGTGTGEPEQVLTVGRRPLVEQSFALYSLEAAGWRRWKRVDDLGASRRASADYLLDPSTGEVTFGDGEQGRTPPLGCLMFATVDATRAEQGAARITGIADTVRNRVLLPDPGVRARVTVAGDDVLDTGAVAEPIAHAIGRAIESREAHLRAVTVEDFEAIALATPGTDIARALVRPNLYPGLDCVNAAGVITVVLVPRLPCGRPAPSAGLIAAVTARIERRRTIGTRVVVTGPTYVEVTVRARVRALDGVDRGRLARQVADALTAFFDPLAGGPDKAGWPLGRDVFRAEVMQAIDETPGVDHVLALDLVAEGCEATCGNLCIRPTGLVAAGAHAIEVL